MDTKGTVIPKAFKKSKAKPKSGIKQGQMMYMKEIKKARAK